MPGLALFIALLAAATQPDQQPALPVPEAAAQAATPDIIQAKADRDDRLTVPVDIEGNGPYHFVVDTGSQRTVASTKLATDLGLAAGPSVRVVGLAGEQTTYTARVGTMRLGKRSLDDLTMPLFERHNIGADGVLGTDSLQGQRVLLDFTDDSIVIGDSRSLGGDRGYEIVVRAKRRSGQLVMTRAKLDGITVAVILDTGAGTSVGNRALQRALAKRRGSGAMVTLHSITGQVISAEIGFAERLDLRDISITNLIIAFTDTPAFTALELEKRPALFLGMREMRLFQRIAIDFGKKRVMFDLPRND